MKKIKKWFRNFTTTHPRKSFALALAIYKVFPYCLIGKKLFYLLSRLAKTLKDEKLAGKVYYATPLNSPWDNEAGALWLSFW
jgi:hypothetical protein